MILIKKINHNKIFQIIMGKNFSNIKVVLGSFGI